MSTSRDSRAEAVAHPLGGILRLQIAGRRELRERVAGAPEGLGRLLRAELAAVPDDRGLDASRRRAGGQALDSQTAARGERPLRIDLRADGVAVMDEDEMQ